MIMFILSNFPMCSIHAKLDIRCGLINCRGVACDDYQYPAHCCADKYCLNGRRCALCGGCQKVAVAAHLCRTCCRKCTAVTPCADHTNSHIILPPKLWGPPYKQRIYGTEFGYLCDTDSCFAERKPQNYYCDLHNVPKLRCRCARIAKFGAFCALCIFEFNNWSTDGDNYCYRRTTSYAKFANYGGCKRGYYKCEVHKKLETIARAD